MAYQRRNLWIVMGALAVLAGACMTYKAARGPKGDRGIRMGHAVHTEEGLDCTDCHVFEEELPFPTHETCGICHDIEEDTPSKECKVCHTYDELLVEPYVSKLPDDVRFSHASHMAEDLECGTCHPDPDGRLFAGEAVKASCMECHADADPSLNECDVCHREIRVDVRPKFRGSTAISHDIAELWERTHGRESRVDPTYCAYCHDTEAYCEDCHTKNPPSSHTLSWRRRTHGLNADWDRRTCATCHEEDFCVKCHQNTAPSSHRRGWRKRHGFEAAWNQDRCTVCHEEDACVKCHRTTPPTSHLAGWTRPINGHCKSCHFPATTTKCAMCHESIHHRSALPSPHTFGIYPKRCGLCHPGGLPRRAPHVLNGSVRCEGCH